MKQLWIFLLVAIFSSVVMAPDAEARRLGGGGNFGMKRQVNPPKTPQQNINRPNQAPAGAKGAGRSWMGPIAGLAAGLGLAALFSHLGLGAEMASFVLLALLIFGAILLFRMLSRRAAAGSGTGRLDGRMQYAGSGVSSGMTPPTSTSPESMTAGGAGSADRHGQSSGFDQEAFVKQAKVQFIRLQAAHDEGNVEDIREFTTPEVFAEIRVQMAERGSEVNHTDVVELNAEVVDVAEEDSRYIVTVRFHGLLREQPGAAPEAFDEMWHLTKSVQGDRGWVIAGIQQVS